MKFFKSLKGDLPDNVGDSSTDYTFENKKKSGSKTHNNYIPPPGPPPSYDNSQVPYRTYDSSSGPPPSQNQNCSSEQAYTPPPGPPPSHQRCSYTTPISASSFEGHQHDTIRAEQLSSSNRASSEPLPYHDWTSVPDTALLPPPPAFSTEASPSGNASLSDALRAHRWCEQRPLIRPHQPAYSHIECVKNGDVALMRGEEYKGDLSRAGTELWRGITNSTCKESCLLTSLPLYFAAIDSPTYTKTTKTIYFEVNIVSLAPVRSNQEESCLALGFCAIPYPTWRMPGWERGSLGVYTDDGRRFVNNTDGGIEFTSPIRTGETVGIGITYSVPNPSPDYKPSPVQGTSLNGEVFFTRNGRKDGGWNIHEELDADTEFGAFGVDGKYDLYGAIGAFGKAKFEASFNSRDWLYQPR